MQYLTSENDQALQDTT